MNRIQRASLKIQTLPVLTWRHLQMNGCELDVSFEQAPFLPSDALLALEKEALLQRIPSLSPEGQKEEIRNSESNDGDQSLTSFVRKNANAGYQVEIAEGDTRATPLVLDYLLDEGNPTLIETLVVDMQPGSSATLIKGLRTSSVGLRSFHAGSTRVHVGQGANLTLIQLRFLSEGATDLDQLSVTLGEHASFSLVEIVVGDAHSYIGTHIDMQGNASECSIGCMNVVDKESSSDFNFHVEHKGEGTNSTQLVRGALLNSASKLFRGTIDFHKGCNKSKGSEDEYTVLLSPAVKNRSVPLILCAEEDVEGEHAVSSGRLDSNALFYLTSRGIGEKRAKRLLVEAQLYPILALVSDKEVLAEIEEQLFRRLDSHGY